jgi:hypothetical protein
MGKQSKLRAMAKYNALVKGDPFGICLDVVEHVIVYFCDFDTLEALADTYHFFYHLLRDYINTDHGCRANQIYHCCFTGMGLQNSQRWRKARARKSLIVSNPNCRDWIRYCLDRLPPEHPSYVPREKVSEHGDAKNAAKEEQIDFAAMAGRRVLCDAISRNSLVLSETVVFCPHRDVDVTTDGSDMSAGTSYRTYAVRGVKCRQCGASYIPTF